MVCVCVCVCVRACVCVSILDDVPERCHVHIYMLIFKNYSNKPQQTQKDVHIHEHYIWNNMTRLCPCNKIE